MQLQYKNITLIILFTIGLFGCFKEVEEVSSLNTNIFDRDYAGEKWYVVEDSYLITNELGQNKVRNDIVIPDTVMPGLRPSKIAVMYTGPTIDTVVADIPQSPLGGYRNALSLPYVGADSTYCFSIGIYIEEEDAAINIFETCVKL